MADDLTIVPGPIATSNMHLAAGELPTAEWCRQMANTGGRVLGNLTQNIFLQTPNESFYVNVTGMMSLITGFHTLMFNPLCGYFRVGWTMQALGGEAIGPTIQIVNIGKGADVTWTSGSISQDPDLMNEGLGGAATSYSFDVRVYDQILSGGAYDYDDIFNLKMYVRTNTGPASVLYYDLHLFQSHLPIP